MQRAVDVALLDVGLADSQGPGRQRLVRAPDRLDRPVHDHLVRRLDEAEGRHLRENIVVPAAGARVRVRTHERKVVVRVDGIVVSQGLEAVEDAAALE
jgi:hypothetical protein